MKSKEAIKVIRYSLSDHYYFVLECPKCGHELEDYERACPECGQAIKKKEVKE